MKKLKQLIGSLILLAGIGCFGTFFYGRYYSGQHLHLQKVQISAQAGTVEYELDLEPGQSPISVMIGEVKKDGSEPTRARSVELNLIDPAGEQIWQSDARLSKSTPKPWVPTISKKRKRKRLGSFSLTTSSFPDTDIHKVVSIDDPIAVHRPGTHKVQVVLDAAQPDDTGFELAIWMRQNTMVVPTKMGVIAFVLLILGGYLLRPGSFSFQIGRR